MTPTIKQIPLHVGGEWVEGGAAPIPLTSPGTGERIAEIHQGSTKDVGRAVEAAERAFVRLSAMTAFERAALTHTVADLLLERREEIATDLSFELGKPYRTEALAEIDTAAGMFRDAAECAKRLTSEYIPSADPDKRVLTIRQPRGVYGLLTPWNFPVAIPSEYLSAGLATGNAMVWKPSEYGPVSAWHLMRCFEEAEVPEGTLNLVQGPPAEIGGEVASHPGIVAIGMTGSSRTGKIVARLAAGKPMLLELGGNGPTILFEDADLDYAIARAAFGSFSNAGQICSSTERILVHGSIEKDVVQGLSEEAAKVRLGLPFDDATTMGPVANEPTATKMGDHLKDALEKGAEVVFGGSRVQGFPTSLYYQPTVISGVTPLMRLNAEETFGPVAPVMTFDDEDKALEWANSAPLGLNGSVFTRDMRRAFRVAEKMQTGTVNINETSAYWQPHTPAGGYTGKQSGIGRIGGIYTQLEMTQTKTINIDIQGR
ncbi:MAG: aldehyde dehydrogenase family protein [Actinomycetota bacterium]